jgi:coenzyme F420-reducing hydrogenase gamma subunit
VWKFASCDGCQLSILDCEDELLELARVVDIAYFPEATRAPASGTYDLSLVEGSITTPDDALRIQKVRRQSGALVAIGACATAGGIQALRNFDQVGRYASLVYEHPEWIEALEKSTPIRNHVFVDYELRGCPISKAQLVDLLTALLAGRKPNLPTGSVCLECKRKGTPCLMVSRGIACMGPVTHAGCGALCPSFGRGCYGCFGPSSEANIEAMSAEFDRLGITAEDQVRAFRQINAYAEPFRAGAEAVQRGEP